MTVRKLSLEAHTFASYCVSRYECPGLYQGGGGGGELGSMSPRLKSK